MDSLSQNGQQDFDEDQQYHRAGPDMDRIRNAKKRRIMQLKRWTQYDKVKEKEEISRVKKGFPLSRRGPKSVRFSQNLILLEAGNHGDTEEVRRLLSEGVCADVSNSDGLSALHQCAINKNIDMCRVLINYSANVNAKDKEHWTPLHAAAICGHTEICLLLIRSGADLLALNTDGNMPYDICEDEITLDAIENEMASRGITQEMINDARNIPERSMLRDVQAVVSKHGQASSIQTFNQLDKQGANFLHIAASSGFAEVTRYLITLGVPLDTVDKDGWQAIHIAALYNQLEVVEILVTNGANIDAQTKQGETIYELVYDKEMYDKLMLLKLEVDKMKDNHTLVSSLGLVRRRSSTNPRSASIRRTSMKEKSILSWKEAKQEAEIRITVESGLVDKSKIDEFINSSLRVKHNSVPETIVEDCAEPETDLKDIKLDVKDSDYKSPHSDFGNKDLRGSFTHPHPYNSPTRDPETFPYTPKPVIPTPVQVTQRPAPKPEQPIKVRHSAGTEKPPPSRNMTNIPHNVRSSQENLDLRHPSTRSKDHGAHNPSKDPPRAPGGNQRQPAVSPLQRTSVPSVKSASNHTTPIGSVKSSSQNSLHKPPQREESRKQNVNRYYKPPKPDACCQIM